ncbi:MAG: DUF1697 domain-containing protein [Actinomycetota bacterium]
MARYVALLRGINVGGKNQIRMADLKACFGDLGFENVATYIASGNVLFDSGERSSTKLTKNIEEALTKTFRYEATVVVRSKAQLRKVVEEAPKGYGSQPSRYRSDVLFLMPPLTSAATIKSIPTKEGVDQVHAGQGVLYFSRLTSKATSSRLSRLISMPIYRSITIRSWSTTVKLQELMDGS